MTRLLCAILFTLSALFTLNIHAQQPIEIGKSYTLKSSVLNEDRSIQIYLPPGYNDTKYPNQQYPVIYLLDGETNFNYLTAYIDKLSKYPYPAIPEMIIVGIVNTNRNRDLTPSKVITENMSKEQANKIKGENGGNGDFFKFISQELFPYIDTTYRTLDYKVFIGHSFGGITALNNLLNRTDMFNAYIVHDPSIWWDNKIMLKEYTAHPNKDFHYRRLYLTQVGESESKGHLSDHYDAIRSFNDLLISHPPINLAYKYAQYDGEDHGSIPMKGNLDGLRYIYEGYHINFKEIKTNPTLIQDSFKKLSESMHYDFRPTEKYLDTVIQFYNNANDKVIVDIITTYKDSLYKK